MARIAIQAIFVLVGGIRAANAVTAEAAPKLLPPGWLSALRRGAEDDATVVPAAGPAALGSVVADMDAAARALAALATAPAAGESQQAAIEKLDAALAQMQRQCQQCMGGTCNKPGTKSSKSSRSAKKAGSKPAREVVATTAGAAEAARLAEREALIRAVWGQLPQRRQDELMQPLREEFLSDYAPEIEAYFRELAEQRDADPVETKP